MGFMQPEPENEETYQEDNQRNGESQYIQVSEICKRHRESTNTFVPRRSGHTGKQQSASGKQIQRAKRNHQRVNFGIDN